jgi:peptide-methionine (S)-S-oxide reductase
MTTTLATFAAGCFWGAEEAFRTQLGVIDTVVGIMDGAEVVQITFDPAQTPYETLLNIFWHNHNPTLANPGGLERSEVFFHDEEQRAIVSASKQALEQSGRYRKPIATPLSPVSAFKRAPEDQQQYYLKHGMASCHT